MGLTWKPVVAAITLALFVLRGGYPHAFSAAARTPVMAMDLAGADVELVKWSVTQGGLSALLIWVLWSYRRDFFRKIETKQAELEAAKDEKRLLAEVLDKNALAMQQQALAVQANTRATETLATNVFVLADRRREPRG